MPSKFFSAPGIANDRRSVLAGISALPSMLLIPQIKSSFTHSSTIELARSSNNLRFVRTASFAPHGDFQSGARFVSTGLIEPAKAGSIFAKRDDFFVYDADGRQYAYAEQEFVADRFGVTHDADGESNIQRLNDLIYHASERPRSGGAKTVVIVPQGTGPIDLAGKIILQSNISLINRAHLRYTGPASVGHFLQVTPPVKMKQPGRLRNVEISGGGVFDSNNVGNANAIAIGNRDNADPDGLQDVWIHDVTVMNARHGGPHVGKDDDLSDIVRGGGKGLTVQFGAKNVLVERVTAMNCDIGLSIEGKHTRNGYVRDVVVDKYVARDCRLMGAYLAGSYDGRTYGIASSAKVTDFLAIDCANGRLKYSDQLIAEEFGVITCSAASNIRFQGAIRNTKAGPDNTTTVLRGSHRDCRFDLTVTTARLHDLVRFEPARISKQSASASKNNTYRIEVSAFQDDLPVLTGFLFRDDSFRTGAFDAQVRLGTSDLADEWEAEKISNRPRPEARIQILG